MDQKVQSQKSQPFAATAATAAPLDQLEAQVNLVLEHTGRVFAGSARSQKGNGVVNNPVRLRQVFAGAIDNFHDALDLLEEELAIARAVMRRDLAVCRTALEAQNTDARIKEQNANTKLQEESKSGQSSSDTAQDTDVTMTGDSPQTLKESPTHDASKPAPVAPMSGREQPEQPLDSMIDLTGNHSDDNQAPRNPLQIEIPSGEHTGGDNPTDAATGTYSNFDFESLFNDPSAHPSPNVQPSEAAQESAKQSPIPTQAPAPEPQPEKPSESINIESSIQEANPPSTEVNDTNNNNTSNNSNDSFDFGDLTNFGDSNDMADNDNISSLLPGLESYANAPDQPQQSENNTTDTFNIFDAAGAPDFGHTTNAANSANVVEQAKPIESTMDNQGQGEGDGEMRDSTFDDLMNFDNFDMGSFGADDNDDGKPFDASFFDIS